MQFGFGFDRIDGVERARTLPMFEQLLRMRIESDADRADAAASFVKSLVSGLAERACAHAREEGLRQVGLSGGVSYSGPVTAWVKETVEREGLEFIGHERISNGDGGISTGQNAIAGALLG
jgi:hydrogenase maturation protein HypF